MSYSTLDAYGRRPTDSNRRFSGQRDRRREVNLKAPSESHGEDRRRRDTDSPAASRADSSTKAYSTSRSPLNASPDSSESTTCEELVRLCKAYAEAVVEVARLKAERDPLAKVLRQRQVEYEKSTVKYTEFPSVPEVQNMHRVKYMDRVRALNGEIQKWHEEVDKTARLIARAVLNLRSPHTRDAEPNSASSTGLVPPHNLCEKQQAEISELKSRILELEAQRSQERSDLWAEFAREKAEMKRQMEEMMGEMRRELQGEKAARLLKDAEVKGEMANDLEKQLGGVRREMARQQRQIESQLDKVQSQLSKHEETLGKMVEEQQKQALKANAETAPPTSEPSAVPSHASDLLARVDGLARELAQNTADTFSLRTSQAAWYRRLEGETRKIEEHEAKLSNIDFDALEGVAELISFDFPNLKRKVDDLHFSKDDLDKLRKSSEAKDEAVLAKVKAYMDAAGKLMGGMVDAVRKITDQHECRIKALEKVPASSAQDITPATSTGPDYEALRSDVVSIQSETQSIKAVVERLAKEFKEKAELVDQKITTASQDLNHQMDLVRHSLTVLDSQFNALSTKKLAEHIIGQLEQVYPDARQIASDIDSLKRLADEHRTRIDSLEGHLREFKGKVTEFTDNFETALSNSLSNGLNGKIDELDEYRGKNVNGHKRKRTKSSLDGGEHLLAHGST